MDFIKTRKMSDRTQPWEAFEQLWASYAKGHSGLVYATFRGVRIGEPEVSAIGEPPFEFCSAHLLEFEGPRRLHREAFPYRSIHWTGDWSRISTELTTGLVVRVRVPFFLNGRCIMLPPALSDIETQG